ncbi:MAG: M20/M25/M40 family metallo-hydrolase [Kiritimatiellaeota bacterium]|nr:M20/M25/M40 family metallo-hydrolase [Kiritimatiellota bacterium]
MKTDVIALCKDLIAIPSINPMGRDDLDPTLTGEARVNDYIRHFVKAAGVDIVVQRTDVPGRENVGGMIVKGSRFPTLVLQCHTDTLGVGDHPSLLKPAVCKGRLYGRGATDDKGGLAAMLVALAEAALHPARVRNNVIVLGVSDEEYKGKGSLALVAQPPTKGADFGLVGEPTECRIVNGFKGVARWDLVTTGRSVHSSMPQKGVSAIYRMARLVSLIEDYQRELAKIEDPPLGCETISVGRIVGGTAVNVVPDSCTIEIDQRITRKTRAADAPKRLAAYLRKRGMRFPVIPSAMKDVEDAVLIAASHPGISLLGRMCLAQGLNPRPCQVAYGSDAFRMNRGGIPTVLWGPGSIKVAHSNDEYVEIRQLEQAVIFYLELMQTDLQKAGVRMKYSPGSKNWARSHTANGKSSIRRRQ